MHGTFRASSTPIVNNQKAMTVGPDDRQDPGCVGGLANIRLHQARADRPEPCQEGDCNPTVTTGSGTDGGDEVGDEEGAGDRNIESLRRWV